METEKGLFFVYLRERGKAIACLCLFTGIFAGTFLLYRVPWQAAAYPAALCLGLGVLLLLRDYRRFRRVHEAYRRLTQLPELTREQLPQGKSQTERDCAALLEKQLEDIIQKIVGQAGREVNQANPIVDTRLPDGSRVNVVLPPISLNGAIVTIRKFSKTPMTVQMLLRYGSITPEVARVLEMLVKAKYNIFICGGTGSGKTTFLNAISNFIPHDERVITIEDSAELQIEGIDNLVSLETRNANASGHGAVSIRDLIRSSLRMRPERIIVGEVRGGEALDMLQAMNTGHDGSLSPGHANSTRAMLSRLETMVLQGADGLPLEAIRQQIASAVDVMIHLSRLRDKSRRTMEICEVLGYEDGEIQLNPIYEFVEDEHSTLEHVSGQLKRTENPFINDYKLRLSGNREVI